MTEGNVGNFLEKISSCCFYLTLGRLLVSHDFASTHSFFKQLLLFLSYTQKPKPWEYFLLRSREKEVLTKRQRLHLSGLLFPWPYLLYLLAGLDLHPPVSQLDEEFLAVDFHLIRHKFRCAKYDFIFFTTELNSSFESLVMEIWFLVFICSVSWLLIFLYIKLLYIFGLNKLKSINFNA
jgi:hypothetical protein